VLLKIGFVQGEDDLAEESEPGYIDPAAGVDDDSGWVSYATTVFLHYSMVNGMVAIIRDLIDFFW